MIILYNSITNNNMNIYYVYTIILKYFFIKKMKYIN